MKLDREENDYTPYKSTIKYRKGLMFIDVS